jgi:outer membrane protein TolC
VLGRRRRVAEADALRLQAQTETVREDVLLDAARAFLMLEERRDTAHILATQRALASDFVSATSGRYGAGTGSQSDVLRAEVELARLDGATRASRPRSLRPSRC